MIYWIKAVVSWIVFLPLTYGICLFLWVVLPILYAIFPLPKGLYEELSEITREAHQSFFGWFMKEEKPHE